MEGLQRNRGLLVLDLEYKSIASGEGICQLLTAHPTLAVSGQGVGKGGSGVPQDWLPQDWFQAVHESAVLSWQFSDV